VASEHSRVELNVSNDPRLIRAVGGAVEHVAQRIGFNEGECRDLVAAAEQACRDTLQLLFANNATLGVTVEDFPDRVEITLLHQVERGRDASARQGAKATAADERRDQNLLSWVDRVEQHTSGGTSRMTLVRYLHPRRARP